MSITNILDLKERLDFVKYEQGNEGSSLAKNLNEKGVECSILIPILETAMGFDALKDINYESSSTTRNNQRFDFLIEDCFLIEAKALNIDLQKNEIRTQIKEYIFNNDNINFGFLSNGFTYIFFIQKSYIKSFLTGNQELLVPIKKDVLPVFEISINDKKFLEIMQLFSKDTYKVHFERIARYVLSQYNQGHVSKIASDREINEEIKKLIKNTVKASRGYYLGDIKDNKILPGTRLSYEDDNIKITISIEDNGTIKLSPKEAIIKNMNEVMEGDFAPMIDLVQGDWRKSPQIFTSPEDLIRLATNRKKLSKEIKEKYAFK